MNKMRKKNSHHKKHKLTREEKENIELCEAK